MKIISNNIISDFQNQLETHSVYQAVSSIEDLQLFMEHHIYSVWDFMSLVKFLQSVAAPTQVPWTPQPDGNIVRFINELVLEEECDEAFSPGGFTSHFQLYMAAMEEIGANTSNVRTFIKEVESQGVDKALMLDIVPKPSRIFTQQTFRFIQSGEPQQVAAALALGREHIIPSMFRAILDKIGIDEQQAPTFHYYLNRHIRLDEDFHAPLSLKLLNELCAGDPNKVESAIAAAQQAVEARINFWNGVLTALKIKND